MAAFKYTYSSQIERNIYAMFYRLKKVSSKNISHNDFISMFVPAHDRQMYRTIAIVAGVTGSGRALHKWGDVVLGFALNQVPGLAFPPPIPRSMVLQPDAPEELVQNITAWSLNGGDASGDFGRVMKLFKTLNEELTRSQLRFVWPSIIAICRCDPDVAHIVEIGDELQELKAPAIQPVLPHGLLLACRKTAASVALASLIPRDAPDPELGEVTVEAVNGRTYSERDLGEFSGLT
jgi:hypothetical protein